jgi:hypothetical protein
LSVVALRALHLATIGIAHTQTRAKDGSACAQLAERVLPCMRACVRARTHEQAVHPAERELDEVEARLLQVRVQLDVHLRASTRSLLCSAQQVGLRSK